MISIYNLASPEPYLLRNPFSASIQALAAPPPPLLLEEASTLASCSLDSSGCHRATTAAAAAAAQTLTLMPQQEVPDQIAAGWFAVEAPERPGSLQRSGSYSRLNAQAREFVPRVAAVVRVFAAPPPPSRPAFFAPPPPFEFFASLRVGGGFAAKEPELEREGAAPEPSTMDGLADEVAQKITKQVGVAFFLGRCSWHFDQTQTLGPS